MKRFLMVLLVLSVVGLSMSCDEEVLAVNPQVRGYLSSTWNSVYGCLGTVDSNGYFSPVTNWVLIPSGGYSSYLDVEPGTYHVIYDTDTDHTYATYYQSTHTVERNKKYTFTIDSSQALTFSED